MIINAADLVQILRRPILSLSITAINLKQEQVALTKKIVLLEQVLCAKSNNCTNKTLSHHSNKQRHSLVQKSISSDTILRNNSKGSLNRHLEGARAHKNLKENPNPNKSLSQRRISPGQRMRWSRWWMWSLATLKLRHWRRLKVYCPNLSTMFTVWNSRWARFWTLRKNKTKR